MCRIGAQGMREEWPETVRKSINLTWQKMQGDHSGLFLWQELDLVIRSKPMKMIKTILVSAIDPALERIRNIHPKLPLYSFHIKKCPICHERLSLRTLKQGEPLCEKCRKNEHRRLSA
jgi:hypothetical protein